MVQEITPELKIFERHRHLNAIPPWWENLELYHTLFKYIQNKQWLTTKK